jgi:hypothetical protein
MSIYLLRKWLQRDAIWRVRSVNGLRAEMVPLIVRADAVAAQM